MRHFVKASILGLLALYPSKAFCACPGPELIASYVTEFEAAKTSQGFGKDISLAEAQCAKSKLAQALTPILGAPVGYKAVFTNPDAQKRFGVPGPAWGVMYGRWMFNSNAKLPKGFGALQRYESDFIVIVKDAGLAEARSPLQALQHISALTPFVELPDMMLDGKITGPELIATNSAFRGGVLGAPIQVVAKPELLQALAEMEIVVTNETTGQEIGRERGRVLMDQPIKAAMWLAKALKKDGIRLKPGDMLSLGGFLASKPILPGSAVSVQYKGLPGDPKVLLAFE